MKQGKSLYRELNAQQDCFIHPYLLSPCASKNDCFLEKWQLLACWVRAKISFTADILFNEFTPPGIAVKQIATDANWREETNSQHKKAMFWATRAFWSRDLDIFPVLLFSMATSGTVRRYWIWVTLAEQKQNLNGKGICLISSVFAFCPVHYYLTYTCMSLYCKGYLRNSAHSIDDSSFSQSSKMHCR